MLVHDFLRDRVVARNICRIAVRPHIAVRDGSRRGEDQHGARRSQSVDDTAQVLLVRSRIGLMRIIRIIRDRVAARDLDALQVVQAEVEVDDLKVAAINLQPLIDFQDALGGPGTVLIRPDNNRLICE